MEKTSVDIVVPVYYGNIKELRKNIPKQVNFFRKNFNDYNWNVIISINGSNASEIIELSKNLSKKYNNLKYIYFKEAGKGVGVMEAWKKSNADIITYMDIDLSTDLKYFRNLINPIEQGYDICIGSRYHKNSKMKRSFLRHFISSFYHIIFMKIILNTKYTDSQCGFKAVNKKVVKEILPLVKDKFWFFETEFLYIAQKKGFKIKEIPIMWEEDITLKSGVNLIKIIFDFIEKVILLRLRKI